MDFPPLCIEISPDDPLLIFDSSAPGNPAGMEEGGAPGYARHVAGIWDSLPAELKPFSTIQVETKGSDAASRHERFSTLLLALQEADIPAVIRIADGHPKHFYPLAQAEELVRDFTCVKGLQAADLSFEEYYEFGDDDPLGTPPAVLWLMEAIDLAARYGRFMSIELSHLQWPRVMSNTWCKPLYEKLRQCRAYVVPTATYRGAHTIPGTSALLGLWLEGAAAQWGVAPNSHWYRDAHFLEPGVFGVPPRPSDNVPYGRMPPYLYRAMILNGAMMGATAYSFAPSSDLWFGPDRRYWDEAIFPTLREIIDGSLIARRDFVEEKVKVAFHLTASRTAEDFHLNLRDIDGVLDKGLLMHGAYGMERPGQIPELIPDTGHYYWIPILSAHAPATAWELFDTVVQPAVHASADSWRALLDEHYGRDGEGSAFIASVGRGIFVMNTRENRYEEQTFRIPETPAPVRGLEVKRQDDGDTGASALLTWPFREADFSYKVYRRVPPNANWQLLDKHIDARSYLDYTLDASQTTAYAVTALTSDVEPYEGTVNLGEYLALSVVESRIAEEAIIGPLLGFAKAEPVASGRAPFVDTAPATANAPGWPNYSGLEDNEFALARAIVERIEAWDRAFAEEDLTGVLNVYSTEYEDPEGWRFQYVRRAYQWFFEHYNACTMHRQIRQWDFRSYDNLRQVGVLLYCRFTGFALTGPAGRFADVPAQFPRTDTCEVWVHFSDKEGPWRIIRAKPALPSFRDILAFSASPLENLPPGPDL